jgi:hypothetical protein
VREVRLRGLDEVRDEVVPALQLHVDLREGVAVGVPSGDEAVEQRHPREPHQDREAYDDREREHPVTLLGACERRRQSWHIAVPPQTVPAGHPDPWHRCGNVHPEEHMRTVLVLAALALASPTLAAEKRAGGGGNGKLP